MKELLKTHSKVQSSKSCGDFREVLFLLFQKREKSKSEGFFIPSFCHLVFRPFPSPLSHPLFLPLAELGKTKASWNCQCMQVFIEESHICFLHWTQKAITIFPISLLGEGPEEGKTVPVRPVRFSIRFQRFTVPTVRKLFDFLRFGSTVPVRFQNLPVSFVIFVLARRICYDIMI